MTYYEELLELDKNGDLTIGNVAHLLNEISSDVNSIVTTLDGVKCVGDLHHIDSAFTELLRLYDKL